MKASEKIGVYGAKALSDEEVLSVLVGDVAADEVLRNIGMAGLNQIEETELCAVDGIGSRRAAILKAASKRYTTTPRS